MTITMQKLLSLVNQYHSVTNPDTEYRFDEGSIWLKEYQYSGTAIWTRLDEIIISKRFGFIKWLVEKRKVEWFLIPEIIKKVEVDSSGLHDHNEYYENWEILLMLLAIQEDPISFLVSILK